MNEQKGELVTPRPEAAAWSSVPAVASDIVAESGGRSARYWQALKHKKGLLLAATIGGSILGYCATLPALKVYQARTSVEIDGINEDFLNMKQSDPVSFAESRSDGTDLGTQIAILTSASLRARVAAKLGGAPEPTKSQTLVEKLGLDRRKQDDDPGQALSLAADSVRVTPSPESRVIEVTVDSTNPSMAANFANTLVNEFIEQNIESRWQSSLRTGQYLTRQIEDMRVKLEQSESKLQQHARQAGLLSANEKSSVAEERLRQVQEQLSKAQVELVAKRARNEMLISNPEGSVPDILSDAGIQGLEQKIGDLRRQIADLTITYTTESPQVRRLLAQIGSIEQARDTAVKMITQKIRNEYEEALQKERLIEDEFQQLKAQVSSEGERTIEYNLLKGEVESNRHMYDAMLQQLKQSGIASAMRASTVRVVDPAEKPGRPYKPNRERAAIMGAIVGCFLCVGLVVLRLYADKAIRDPGEVAAWVGVPELGLIPNYRIGRGTVYQPKAPMRNALAGGRRPSADVASWQSPSSRFAESFRATLMSMLFTRQNGSRPRTLVVTSAGPKEGKSTVAANLGAVLAQMGVRVLLIDADLRKPRLHKIFGIEPQMGLINVLNRSGASEEETENEKFIYGTELQGLSVLPAGGTTAESANLLYGDRLAKLFQRLRDQYDMVLVDTPPMLEIPDARIVGRATDTTILVARAGATTRSAVSAATQRLSDDGIDLMGVIVNDWSPSNSSTGYYGYSYYTTYYSSN